MPFPDSQDANFSQDRLRGKSNQMKEFETMNDPAGVPVCFSCDKGVETGGELFSVVRQRVAKTRKLSDGDQDCVLEVLPSIQVCGNCMREVPDRSLALKLIPLPLLGFEREAIEQYANWLAWWPVTEVRKTEIGERLVCQECHSTVETWDVYVLIQIVRATETESEQVLALLRILCDDCAAKQGMIWFKEVG
jgi:hypothetical protein